MIRFVVCIDVDGTTLVDAYRKLRAMMRQIDDHPALEGWETSDEAYGHEGEEIDEGALSAARLVVLDEEDAAG